MQTLGIFGHTYEEGTPVCERCEGTGRIIRYPGQPHQWYPDLCPRCLGQGVPADVADAA